MDLPPRISLLLLSVSIALLAAAPRAEAGPCGSGVDLAHIEAINRQDLWAGLVDCNCSGAGAATCAAWCSSLAACTASGDPTCSIADDPSCDATMSNGGACYPQASACGADTTGGITCEAWFEESGDAANIIPYGPLDNAIALSNYACLPLPPPAKPGIYACPSCANACSSAGLDTTAASFKCGICLGASAPGADCLGS